MNTRRLLTLIGIFCALGLGCHAEQVVKPSRHRTLEEYILATGANEELLGKSQEDVLKILGKPTHKLENSWCYWCARQLADLVVVFEDGVAVRAYSKRLPDIPRPIDPP